MASHRERIMEKTRKFQIVYAGLSNLCQQSTPANRKRFDKRVTNGTLLYMIKTCMWPFMLAGTIGLRGGIMTNGRIHSALSRVRSSKHKSKTTSSFVCIQFITKEQVKLVSFT